eukprot:gene10428-7414_t
MATSTAVALPTVPPPAEQPELSMEEKSNWFTYMMMTYLDPIFAVGYQRTLELEDLGGVPKNNRADVLHAKFMKSYEKQKHLPINKRSLWHALWLTVGYWRVTLAMIFFGFSAALQLGPVMVLNRMVKHFQGSSPLNKGQLWILVALLFVFPILSSIFLAHSNAIMANIGAQVRNTLIDIIYRKALTISSAKRQAISTGRIITMFSDDTNQIRNFLFFMNNAVLAPFQIGACLYLIYQQVGAAVFVGLGYSVFVTPVTGVIFAWVFAMRRKKMVKTDGRVKLMNEVLNGIRIIKYYAWENAFYYAWENAFVKKIGAVRKEEVHLLKTMGYLFNIPFALLLLGAPQIQTVLIFLTYIGTGNDLDSATAFTTLTLFGIMTSPFIFLPFGLQQYSQSLVSMRRILEYLDSEDITPYIERVSDLKDQNGANLAIKFDAVNLAWVPELTPEEKAAAEKAAEEEAKKNQKKKDYKALPAAEGKADEEAGKDAEQVGPNRAIDTLTNLSLEIRQGELVGVVGTVGSGKSSVLSALLGEMHLKSGHVYLRDGLSIAYCDQRPWIVNATVRDNILFGREYDEVRFNRAIHVAAMDDDLKILAGGVMTEIGERGINLSGGQKARVCLARAVYNDADIYLLDDPLSAVDAHVGEHIFRKCIKEALSSKTVILVTHHLHVLPQCDRIVILDDNGNILTSGSFDEIMNSGIDVERFLHAPKKEAEAEEEEEGDKTVDEAVAESGEAVVTEGEEASSAVAAAEPRNSARADSHRSRHRTLSSGKKDRDAAADAKLTKDGKLMSKEERNDGEVPWETYWSYISFGGKWAFLFTLLGQVSCQVLQVEANFWLSDWGKETSNINYSKGQEMSKQRSFHWFNGYAGMLMASVFFLTVSRMMLTYHRTEASAKFHDTVLRRTLSGTITIRAYGQSDRFIEKLEGYANTNTVPGVLQQVASQWLAIRLDFLGAIVMFFMGALTVSSDSVNFIPAGYLGLGLSYAIQMTSLLKMMVRVTATMEAQFNAVERIRHYAQNIEYDKVGIAGRTGCGKSSLMVALFRIEELVGGKILIDGLDISRIPLPLLRAKLCIIPQDPVMFSASVRFNLDPFDEFSDEAVWEVLENVNMKDHVLSLPNKLEELVAEGGDNFSAGQRQLICIGRAILRKPKILVMDEATASIDADTDSFIQRMIRQKFKECTVLTIAHRLHTIIDSTKVLVMDGGVVGEFDAPETLLATENGQFKGLWERHVAEGGKTGIEN